MDVNCSNRREKSVLLQYKPSNGGEGWCLVSVYLQGEGKLGIHYECLADKSDEELALTEMRSVEDLYANFRLPSSQLKDNKCSKLIEGWPIVVSYSPAEQGGPIEDTGRKLYFDARLEKIICSKHIRVNGEENCMCTFQILWLAGPKLGQMDKVHSENIYLLHFGCIASHPVLRKAAKFLKSKTHSKSQDLNKEVNNQITGTSDVSFASNSASCSSLVGPTNSRNVPRKISKDRLVIVEDKNGFLVCKIQKVSDS